MSIREKYTEMDKGLAKVSSNWVVSFKQIDKVI